jgi:hypothetical protein
MTHLQCVKGKEYIILDWINNCTMVPSQTNARYFMHYIMHLFVWKWCTYFCYNKRESIFVPKYHSMKMDWGKLYILNLSRRWGKWSVIHSGHFFLRRNLKYSLDTMLREPKDSWVLGQRVKSWSVGNSTQSPSLYPPTSLIKQPCKIWGPHARDYEEYCHLEYETM